jgi:hypothetical protein
MEKTSHNKNHKSSSFKTDFQPLRFPYFACVFVDFSMNGTYSNSSIDKSDIWVPKEECLVWLSAPLKPYRGDEAATYGRFSSALLI